MEAQDLISIASELLENHPNLYADISWLVYDYYFPDSFPDNYIAGNTPEGWASFMERWQDLALIGTDKAGQWEAYPAEVVRYYEILDRLSPDTVRKVLRDNVLGLIKRRGQTAPS